MLRFPPGRVVLLLAVAGISALGGALIASLWNRGTPSPGLWERFLSGAPPPQPAPAYSSDSLPFWSPEPCWFEADSPVACGWLLPSRQDRSGRTALPVVILQQESRRSDTATIYLAGGPGGGSFLYEEAIPEWIAWRDRLALDHDLVLYDQRGTGFALPDLSCDEFDAQIRRELASTATTQAEHEAAWHEYEAVLARCVKQADVAAEDVAARLYSTPVGAQDLLELVRSLRVDSGYARVVLYGVSYGSRLAVEAALRADEGDARIDAMVLDSYYPSGSDLMLRSARTWQEVGEDMLADCARRPACALRTDALRDDLRTLVSRTGPLFATQRIFPGAEWGEVHDVELAAMPYLVFDLLMHALAADLDVDGLPDRLSEALRGEWTPGWQTLAESYVWSALGDSFNPLTHHLMECADTGDYTAAQGREMLARFPAFAPLMVELESADGFCGRLGVTPARLALARVDVETLVLAKQLDPVTPWREARLGAHVLPNARFLLFAGAGHGVVDVDECVARGAGAWIAGQRDFDWSRCDLLDAGTNSAP